MIARADGLASGRGTMPNGLGALHATRPIGLPFGRSVRGLRAGFPTSAERSRCTTQRAHSGGGASLRKSSHASASIGSGRTAQDGSPTARGTCNRTTSKTGAAGGEACARRNDATASKTCSDRGTGAELRSA